MGRWVVGVLCVVSFVAVGNALGIERQSPAVSFVLTDGTAMTGTPDVENLAVQTRYGDLKIPIQDVVHIIPGLKNHPDLAKQVEALLSALGSQDAQARERAQKEITQLGPSFETIIADYAEDQPPERRTLFNTFLATYKKARSSSTAESLRWLDQIETKPFTILGELEDQSFWVTTPYGSMRVNLNDIRRAVSVEIARSEIESTCDYVVAELNDGSQVQGKTELDRIAVATAYGKQHIPLDDIATMVFNREKGTVVVDLHGGDTFVGTTDLESLVMETDYGRLAIPTYQIVKIDIHDTAMEDALAYYWSFDEKNAIDSVREVQGQVLGKLPFAKGIVGSAPEIQNHTTKIVIQSPDFTVNGWRQATFSVWMKPRHFRNYGWAIRRSVGDLSSGFYFMFGLQGTSFKIYLEDHSLNAIVKPQEANFPGKANVWYHLVGTYDGRCVRFYIDGNLVAEQVSTKPGRPVRDLPDAKLVIGRASRDKFNTWYDTYFPGQIDEFKIWRKALTAAQVKQLYEQTLDDKSRSGS